MGWGYHQNESRISVYGLDGIQIGSDWSYPKQPYAADPNVHNGAASTIVRHTTLADGRQIMVHNSFSKGAIHNEGDDNIPSYYLLAYNADYTVRDTIFLMSDRAIGVFPQLTTDNSSNIYLATNYGHSTYWDTGDPIANSNHLDDYIGSSNSYITNPQSNKVVMTRLNPDYSVKWMFEIAAEHTVKDERNIYASDMKTIGGYTYGSILFDPIR